MMKKFFRFLSSKLFLINFGIAIVFFALCFLVLNLFLKSYTRHGDSVTVPNLIGMQIEDAIVLIEESDFNYVIVDTVFDNKYDKGAIVEQNPIPESLVKEGRKIYLKVNSKQDELISMPQLTGFTLRQVTSMMETYGLVIGNLRYIPDIAVNVVIKQIYKGKEIEPGEKIKKGSSIDLILGLGISDKTTTVPSLIGMTYREASNALLDLFLNTGAVNYDNTVKTKNDSLKAKVYRQSPQYSTINEVNLGYNVDIWLTKDESLLNASQNQADDEIENDND
jgi:beta-lactam-binding protein with PASTA domain